MRKRTNWTTDSIVGAGTAVDNGLNNNHVDEDAKSGIGADIDSNRGWSSFQSQYPKDIPSDTLHNPNVYPERFNSLQNPWLRKNRRSHLNTILSSQDVIVRIVGIVIVIGFIVLLAIHGSELLNALAQGISNVSRAIFTATVIALILWGLLMTFIGKVLPSKLKIISFCFIFFICLMGQFVPSLGGNLVELIVAILIIIFIIRLMVG